MNDKMKISTILMTFGALTSCGQQSSSNNDKLFKKPKAKTVTKSTYTKEHPILLEKQLLSTDCTQTSISSGDVKFIVPQFLRGVSTEAEISLMNQLQGNLVRSAFEKPISEITYGYELAETATIRFRDGKYAHDPEKDYEVKVVSEEVPLDICPSIKSYNSFTVESAGVNISHTITKTYKQISKLGFDVAPIKVKIAPIMSYNKVVDGGEFDKLSIKQYQVDNAYYSPRDKEIVFLPQSQKYQTERDSIPFWQIPMVGAHEYGHHIFNTMVAGEVTAKMTFSKNCFQGHDHATSLLDEVGDERVSNYAFALGAINEGFADLVAKYALSEDESDLTNIICFEKNRDAYVDSFGDGAKKVFTARNNNIINGAVELEAPKGCNEPNMQEIHDVGAVFAYSANKIISSYTLEQDISQKILLTFAKNLSKEHGNLESLNASDYIYASLNQLMVTAHKITGASPDKFNCDVISEIFPDNTLSKVCEANRKSLQADLN